MTLLSRYEYRLRSDMSQTVILPFVRNDTVRSISTPSQTTLSNT